MHTRHMTSQVWLEPVPAVYISRLDAIPDIDAGTVKVTAHVSDKGVRVPPPPSVYHAAASLFSCSV